jgi:pimeloyl-ACP methyl ester carboxylesterase
MADRRTFLTRLGSGVIAGAAGMTVASPGSYASEASAFPDVAGGSRTRPGSEVAPTASAISHRHVRTNGIGMHVAEAGSGPLVLLLHGFPELWYSWRHQLPALAEAGYHAVAPDLRGCGETDAPEAVESYGVRTLVADLVGLMDELGAGSATVVGHDWGASFTWALAELYPERVAALVSLGIPYHPRSHMAPTEMLRQFSGDKFSFALYFQQPGVAEAELGAGPRRSLRLFLYALSGDAPPEVVPYLFQGKPASAGVLEGMPEPPILPPWLSEADLDVYARAYARTGFRGALSWYRNMDRDWEAVPSVGAAGVRAPALFVGGRRDSAVIFGRFEPMEAAVPNLRKIVLLPGCGHWTQQERPAAVNAELVSFLRHEGHA